MPILEKVCISLYLGIFQMTPTTAATVRRQFFHLARPPSHSAEGWSILFGNPSLRWYFKVIWYTLSYAELRWLLLSSWIDTDEHGLTQINPVENELWVALRFPRNPSENIQNNLKRSLGSCYRGAQDRPESMRVQCIQRTFPSHRPRTTSFYHYKELEYWVLYCCTSHK